MKKAKKDIHTLSIGGQAAYTLKRLDLTDPDFESVMHLHRRNLPVEGRGDRDELINRLESATCGSTFYVFGFYRKQEVVGYVGVAYLAEDNLFVFDQIFIEKSCCGIDVLPNLGGLLSVFLKKYNR